MSHPFEKTKRNRQIYEDKKTMSWTELMMKWKLNLKTLQIIVDREKRKNEV
jgi:Mor family transcriptional regulator